MELQVKNIKGEPVDTVELSDALFDVPMNDALVHQALVMYEMNKRQGTHSTKTRAQVSGGGRKPWAQKYTGRARQGSIRSPQWRHGGVVFGPHPRDHRLDMPKKMRHLALKCVLSAKARQGRLVLVDELSLDSPSTKRMKEILNLLGIGNSALIVTARPQQDVVLSAHNLQKIWTLPVTLINAEQLLKRDSVIMTVEAARRAEELWVEERPRRGGPVKTVAETAPAPDEADDEGEVGE